MKRLFLLAVLFSTLVFTLNAVAMAGDINPAVAKLVKNTPEFFFNDDFARDTVSREMNPMWRS